jgi:hypothetical protein
MEEGTGEDKGTKGIRKRKKELREGNAKEVSSREVHMQVEQRLSQIVLKIKMVPSMFCILHLLFRKKIHAM